MRRASPGWRCGRLGGSSKPTMRRRSWCVGLAVRPRPRSTTQRCWRRWRCVGVFGPGSPRSCRSPFDLWRRSRLRTRGKAVYARPGPPLRRGSSRSQHETLSSAGRWIGWRAMVSDMQNSRGRWTHGRVAAWSALHESESSVHGFRRSRTCSMPSPSRESGSCALKPVCPRWPRLVDWLARFQKRSGPDPWRTEFDRRDAVSSP